MGSWRSATKFLSQSLGDEAKILTNLSSKLYMGKHSWAVDSIVVHVFVSFVQHIIVSVNAFLITQFL
jgi:hypothetical protein